MRLQKLVHRCVTAALIIVALALLYAVAFRPWHLHQGATLAEVLLPLPGDDLVPSPKFSYTQAISIQARPDEIWPWLVQIGYRRAGWYSHDWIHRLLGIAGSLDHERRSADRVIPELQDLQAGDLIEIAPGMGFEVLELEAGQYLLTGTEGGSWVWVLDPVDRRTTRLIVRNRGTWEPGLVNDLLFGMPNELGSLMMQPKTLRGIKQRVERTGDANE
ncbi:MAG: hypothetical protein PVH41_05870 [Anaerolineae bacterium]|jgi:hypothetical protein